MVIHTPHNIYGEIISAVAMNKDKISYKKKERPIQLSEYTQADFRNDVTDEETLVKLLGQRWKVNLALLGSFVDLYQYLTGRKHITEIPISSTSKALVQIYKDRRHVSRVLELACKVDLLKCTKDQYRFGQYETYSKCYIYNKLVQDLIKSLIAKYDINFTRYIVVNCRPNDIIYNSGHEFSFDKEKHYNVLFSSRLRIPNMTDEECLEILHRTYPFLTEYQALADEMNRTYLKDCPEQQIVFQPSINRSKTGYITKIGIRATSKVCSFKEHENENEGYKGVWRKDYLKEFFGTDKIYSYDVKSSIYRVSHLINFGGWTDESFDFYENIYGQTFSSPEERTMFKDFCQRLYFDSPNAIYSHTKDCYADLLAKGISEARIKADIGRMKAQMDFMLGNMAMNNEVFLHESCLYLDLVKVLRDSGIKVVQVYDGFYSDQDIASLCREILPDIANSYYDKVVDSIY